MNSSSISLRLFNFYALENRIKGKGEKLASILLCNFFLFILFSFIHFYAFILDILLFRIILHFLRLSSCILIYGCQLFNFQLGIYSCTFTIFNLIFSNFNLINAWAGVWIFALRFLDRLWWFWFNGSNNCIMKIYCNFCI